MQTTNAVKNWESYMKAEYIAAQNEVLMEKANQIAVIKTSWRKIKRPSIQTILKILLAQ